MLNAVLSLIIISCSLIIAYLMIRKESLHLRQLEECIAIVKETGERAERFSSSFLDIMTDFQSSNKYGKINIPEHFLNNLKNMKPAEAWKKSIDMSCKYLYQWEKDVLYHFALSIFTCSISDINSCTDNTINKLKDFRDVAKENKSKTIRTNAVCSVSTGLMIALLIL